MNNIVIGNKINRLTVLELPFKFKSSVTGKNLYTIKCLCECGKITYPHKYDLISVRAKSCGCLMREKVSQNSSKRFKGNGISGFNALVTSYKHHAKRKNREF